MSDIRDRAREKIAKLVYSEFCEEYGWKDRWEDVRDKTKEQYLEDADKFLAIPEIAKGLELLEKTAIESRIKSEVQPTPPMDVVTEARLLRADIEQRTIKEVK